MTTIHWLELQDFRCHETLKFDPSEGVNVLLGDNGAGKTSVLEAIAYGSALRSFRGAPDRALVLEGENQGILRLGYGSPQTKGEIEVSIPREGRRRVLLNGKRPGTNADLARAFPTVSFLPDDLDLVKGPPDLRRSLFDLLAAQLSPLAGAAQRDFARALRQRNALLKQDGRASDLATLAVWDDRVSAAGAEVTLYRLDAMTRLGPLLEEAYRSVSSSGEVRVKYRSSWYQIEKKPEMEILQAALHESLTTCRTRDMDLRGTTAGPHRDKPWLELSGRPARSEASQGEQRSLALSLRLASFELIEAATGKTPVLLLDDVFSELDPVRAEKAMELIPRAQVFVTSARDDEVPVRGRRWAVKAGSIQ